MSVPFKVNAHLLAFVSVQFHPIFDRPRLNSGNCALYITSQTSRYRLGDSRGNPYMTLIYPKTFYHEKIMAQRRNLNRDSQILLIEAIFIGCNKTEVESVRSPHILFNLF